MLIFKGILLIILFSIVCLMAGDLFLRFTGWKRTLASAYAWGFVFLLAVFQLILMHLEKNLKRALFSMDDYQRILPAPLLELFGGAGSAWSFGSHQHHEAPGSGMLR